MKIGDELYVVEGRNRGYSKVSKVGRVYFKLADYPRKRFHIKGFVEESEYVSRVFVYPSKEAYESEALSSYLWDKIRNVFTSYPKEVPLENLIKIAEVLKLPLEIQERK